jgi:hypothetical protein
LDFAAAAFFFGAGFLAFALLFAFNLFFAMGNPPL